MKMFYQSSTTEQSLLMISLLLVLIFSLFSLIAAFGNEKFRLYRYIDTVLFLLLFVILTILTNIYSQINDGHLVCISFPFPIWLLWCITGMAFFYLICETVMRYRRRREYLGRNSVKQAMDMFPCVVCYFAPSGAVKLCNLQMHRLFHYLAQKELQTLNDLTQALSECDNQNGIIRFSDERQTYLFPDGKVWRYSQSEVVAEGITYTEAVFSDVTELYEKNLELQRQTTQLEKIALDIKHLSDNVQTLAKEREILTAKSKLHDQMGSGLLAIRRILRQKATSEENAAAVMQFRRAIQILQKENSRPQNDVTEFIQDAAVSGINVKITGELPKDKEQLHLLLAMMREACVNAARHADATALYVESEQTTDLVILRITNDGKQPEDEVVPRGGLADYRKRITQAGGSMEIRSHPNFLLTVTLPAEKRREEE